MTPAEELRAAAALLRQRAEAATPGPWEVSVSSRRDVEVWRLTGDYHQPVCSTGHAGPGIEEGAHLDAAYIATVHPGVGLLLADWLDQRAAEATDWSQHLDVDDLTVIYGPELAVARAILGAGDQPDTGRPA